MTNRVLPALLKPSRADRIAADALPVLPQWWPVDPADAPPLTPGERAHKRREKAHREAASGPYDGHRLKVSCEPHPPRTFVPFSRQDVRYVLDEVESTAHQLVYRYDTTSPIHPNLMAAVAEAFGEADPQYVTTARDEDTRR